MTEAVDDYLKALYQLGEEPNPSAPRRVATGELAQALGVSAPSVCSMLKRLAAQDPPLTESERHGGARLTEEGRRHALRVLRRHRLLEAFLHLHLGYAWDEVHEEADRLEHALSDRFCEALAQFLGRPTQDPHGEPIPETDGTLCLALERALSELPVEAEARVRRVTTRDASLLRYLRERGLVPGARVRLSSRDPFGGSLRLVVEGRTVELGPEAAVALFLERGEDT